MKERIDYIDTTKGIGILLVVWLHMGSVGSLPKFGYWGGYITTFYMVLFFIMSGMFFKPVDIKRKVNRLMIPYISFYIIAFVIHSVKNLIKGESLDWINFFVPLLGGTNGYENTPIWFLLSLSQVTLISYLLLKFWNSKWIIVFSFLLAIAAFNCHKKFGVIPYYIDVTFVTIPFFLFGYYHKTQIIKYIDGGGVFAFYFFYFISILILFKTWIRKFKPKQYATRLPYVCYSFNICKSRSHGYVKIYYRTLSKSISINGKKLFVNHVYPYDVYDNRFCFMSLYSECYNS